MKKVRASACCTGFPNIYSKGDFKTCAPSCKQSEKPFCCRNDCVMKAMNTVDDAGKFDPAKAKESLKAKAAAWVS